LNARVAATEASARRARPGAGSVGAWRDAHLYSMLSSFGRLVRRPGATLLTVGVMAIALALPLCLGLLLQNLERISGSFRAAGELSLFLRPALEMTEVEALQRRVEQQAGVAAVALRTPEEGLAEFREMADLAGALAALDYNPLPAVLIVTPTAAGPDATLAETLRDLPGVDFVQHDAEWRARLGAWLSFGERATMLVAALLGLGALLVVGNTVRLDIQGRAEEIQIVQLLGATDGFVRRPFLYLGAWYGGLAALLAVAIAALAQWLLQDAVAALVASYGSAFALRGLQLQATFGVIGAAVALGWRGAWLATSHQLRLGRKGTR
jgi:cell division transport system permease protein